MLAPSLDNEHPGIRVIGEVASVLQAGIATGGALHGVVSALRRGLGLRRCRLWPRTPDGTRYTAVTTPGYEAELPGVAPPVPEGVRGPAAGGRPGRGDSARSPGVRGRAPRRTGRRCSD